MKTNSVFVAMVPVALLALAGSAKASSTWKMDTTLNPEYCLSGCSTPYNVSAGNTTTFRDKESSGDTDPNRIEMTASAWSTGLTDASSGSTFAQARLMDYDSSGWGVRAGTYQAGESNNVGPHAADNIYGTDLIALNFGSQQVALSSIQIGWNGSDNSTGSYADSDLTILRYVGSGTPVIDQKSLLTTGPNRLLDAGWVLVSHLADVGGSNGLSPGGSASFNTGPGAVSSSWWLVSAYNSAYGGATANNLGNSNDAFKLLAVAGSLVNTPPPPQVPEPAAALLVALGLMGVATSRRRGGKSA